ncbi:hypothetical protein AAHZ94_35875 [Streptomyces sp. HSW2009]|uniref:hypothetical protein n=1 Tax=Streptomyces sp. HSW2009 TaxID=3142890 RepID=UPI0032F071C5
MHRPTDEHAPEPAPEPAQECAAPPGPTPSASGVRARARTSVRLSLGGGTALGIAGVGAVLTFVDLSPPLRAPFTLFFLVVAPAAAIGSALHGVDPLSRPVLAVPGALALDLLVAQALLALHVWSARAGVVTVGVLSLALHVFTCVRRTQREPAEGRA